MVRVGVRVRVRVWRGVLRLVLDAVLVAAPLHLVHPGLDARLDGRRLLLLG